MDARRGEKIGWIGGWTGGFLWVLALAVLWAARGETLAAGGLVVVFGLALVAIMTLTPWRRPHTPYWKLMLPIYGLLAVSVALALAPLVGMDGQGMGGLGFGGHGFGWLGLLWLEPCFIPLLTLGRRTWESMGGEAPR